MRALPLAARLYVGTIIAAGVALFAICLPQARFQQPELFAALLVLSSASAALKVHLPLTAGKSTMSVSYAVDFASLLLLGPHETMLVTAGSALSQCNLNRRDRNPLYRTVFSIASLVITIQCAGLVFAGAWRHGVESLAVGCCPSTGRRGHHGIPGQHAPRGHRDRAGYARAHLDDVAQQLLVDCAKLLRRCGHLGAGGHIRPACGLLDCADYLRAALSDLPHLQRLPRADGGQAAARPTDVGPAPLND